MEHQRSDLTIGIVGLGLMGGSLGMALVRAGFSVAGWDNSPDAVVEAYRVGAINQLPSSLAAAVTGAQIIFVATPVHTIAEVIKSCLPFVNPGTIFSDLGSIKEAIVAEVKSFLPESYHFVAGHPMTGSEQPGIGAADPFLFQNAAYILISDTQDDFVLQRVIAVLETTGAHLMTLTAGEHDRIVATVSHLPHLLAVTLAYTAGMDEETHPGTLNLAAGGFRDTTRIATGSPTLWEGIIFGNQKRVSVAIEAFQQQLDELKNILDHSDRSGLQKFLTKAREVRLQIPSKNKGFLTLLYEMVVTIEDRPGTIDQVLSYLADAGLNIKDIEILRIREGDGGTLRLALEDSDSLEKAVNVLENEGFKVRRR